MSDQVQYVRRMLGETVATRRRYYGHYHNFVVRFKDEDTNAGKGFSHFQHILNMLELPRAKDIILGRNAM